MPKLVLDFDDCVFSTARLKEIMDECDIPLDERRQAGVFERIRQHEQYQEFDFSELVFDDARELIEQYGDYVTLLTTSTSMTVPADQQDIEAAQAFQERKVELSGVKKLAPNIEVRVVPGEKLNDLKELAAATKESYFVDDREQHVVHAVEAGISNVFWLRRGAIGPRSAIEVYSESIEGATTISSLAELRREMQAVRIIVMSLRILAISYAKRALEAGSRERARLRLYAQQLEHYDVIVFTRSSEGYPAVQQDGNLTLYATNSRTRVGMVFDAIKIGRSVLRSQASPVVISSQDPFESSFVGRRLLAGRHQHQVQVHGDVFNKSSAQESLLQRLRVWYGKRAVRKAAQVRVVSERVKRSLVANGVEAQQVTVLPILSDLTAFFAVGENRLQQGARPVTAEQPLRLLYAGRLAPEKNLPMLLRACAELQRQQIAFQVQIVGDGPEHAQLQQLAQAYNLTKLVTFQTWTEDVVSEMANADVLCLTSNHEGWGMVLQEAAAAGLAIVTTDVGCVGELLHANQEAIVVPVGDISKLVQALVHVQDPDVRARLGQAAYRAAQAANISTAQYVQHWVAAHPAD